MNPFGIKTEECNGNDWTTGCTYRLPTLSGCGGMSGMSTFEQLKQSVEKAKAVLTAEARDSRNYFGAGFGSLPSVGMGMSMNLGGGPSPSSSSSGGGVGSSGNIGGSSHNSSNLSSNRMSEMGLIGDLSHLNHLNHHSSHLNVNHSAAIHHGSIHSSGNNSQHDRLSSGEVSTSSTTEQHHKRSSANNNNNGTILKCSINWIGIACISCSLLSLYT